MTKFKELVKKKTHLGLTLEFSYLFARGEVYRWINHNRPKIISNRVFARQSIVSQGIESARTLLEGSLNGGERGSNFDNARHRAQNREKIENTGVALAVHR